MDKRSIPTLVVLAFLVVSVVTGVFLVQQQQYFRLSASSEATPLDVRITNITEDSFNVSFHTKAASVASLNWGEEDSLDNITTNENKGLVNAHSITINNLKPSTKYSFNISLAGETFDNNETPWTATTGNKLGIAPSNKYYSGKIAAKNGSPSAGSIVYIQMGGASMVSTLTSDNGTWIISSSEFRSQTLDRYFDSGLNILMNIFVQTGTENTSTAQIYSIDATSVPEIVLGNSYDFTNIDSDNTGSLPDAETQLPEDVAVSRFELSDTPLKVTR